ncbi:MAG TPA: primosomal protein N', partial [Alphaproteobacteria bacterium]|nr:primosomal protein N' [Alphaproteobacteria bacterium]
MDDLFEENEIVEERAVNPSRTVAVLTTAPVERAYDYAVPEGMELVPGDYVRVPMGKSLVPGVVWGPGAGDVPPARLKNVHARVDLPAMSCAHRAFVDRVAAYTLSPAGAVLKMALSVPGALEPPESVRAYGLSPAGREALSDPGFKIPVLHRAALEVLSDGGPRRAAEVARAAGCGVGVLKTLEKKGLVCVVPLTSLPPCAAPDAARSGAALSVDQARAAQALRAAVEARSYSATLLDGVTGAGKTEVYFEAVATAIAQGRQALILLPEIALSNAFIDRFRARFGCAPALWHSALSEGVRRTTWRGVACGQVRVIVGARSALFLPYADPGLIVVDEEHDAAFKQEEGVVYHARDMAVLRAHIGKIPVVLVSATPSLETIHNVWTERYRHLCLPDRHGGAGMPKIHVLDLKKDRPERQSFLAPTLRRAMAETLAAGEQTLLFLNRRGYAPLTLCRSCGHRMECPRCTAWLVEHRGRARLACHHCGYATPLPRACP